MSRMLLYAAGRRRSPATDAGLQRGRVPRNKGRCYPADGRGDRRRHAPGRHRAPRSTDARADLLCSGAPGYASTRRSPSAKLTSMPAAPQCSSATERAPAAARWAWMTGLRATPVPAGRPRRTAVGPLFCILTGPTRGRAWSPAGARTTAPHRGARRRAPMIRCAPASSRPRRRAGARGVALIVIQRRRGHTNLGITSIDLKASSAPRSSTPSRPPGASAAGERHVEDVTAAGGHRPRRLPGRCAGEDR
jgi:hypothetical protein